MIYVYPFLVWYCLILALNERFCIDEKGICGTLSVHYKLDYVNAGGYISNYYPDFMVKLSDKRIVIVETKGQGDLDVPLEIARLVQWCEDRNRVQTRDNPVTSFTWMKKVLKDTSQLHSGNCWRPSRNTKRKYNKRPHSIAAGCGPSERYQKPIYRK